MNDTMTEADNLLNDVERLVGRTITKSRRDKDRLVGLIFNRLVVTRGHAYGQGASDFKARVLDCIGGCLSRDPSLQKVMDIVEDME